MLNFRSLTLKFFNLYLYIITIKSCQNFSQRPWARPLFQEHRGCENRKFLIYRLREQISYSGQTVTKPMTVIVIFQQLLFFAYFSRVNSGSSACRVCEASSTFMSFIKCYPKSHSKQETLINSQAPVSRTNVSVKKLSVSSKIATITFSGA